MSEVAASTPWSDPHKRAFLLRKLHSLTGVLPVGGFMVFHLFTNAKAMVGKREFDGAVADINHMPFLPLLEAGILLPLLFHAVWGVKIALDGKNNLGRYTFARNWMYTLQRFTGIVAFAFIVFHLWEYRFQKLLGNMDYPDFYDALARNMSSTINGVPVNALVYIAGIAACSFHLANGLWGFCCSWGVTLSRRSQRATGALFALLGVAVFLLGATTAIYFATGWKVPGFFQEHAAIAPASLLSTDKVG